MDVAQLALCSQHYSFYMIWLSNPTCQNTTVISHSTQHDE